MIDREAVETFLYDEASLLDKPDLDQWMTLFTEDGSYWMPGSEDQEDPIHHISHIYDDRVMMEIRRRNFRHPAASSKDWPVRCSHLIGNIRVHPPTDNDTLLVSSNQHIVVWYRDEQRVYATRVQHTLRMTEEGLRIASKRVDLLNPEAPQRSLIIYL